MALGVRMMLCHEGSGFKSELVLLSSDILKSGQFLHRWTVTIPDQQMNLCLNAVLESENMHQFNPGADSDAVSKQKQIKTNS